MGSTLVFGGFDATRLRGLHAETQPRFHLHAEIERDLAAASDEARELKNALRARCAEVAYSGTSKIAVLVSAHVPRPKVLAVETFLPPQILSAATDPSHLAEHDQVVVDESWSWSWSWS